MGTDHRAAAAGPGQAKRFGTFLGVYTPSVLTILGVMMYLRFGWVLGNAGLAATLLIVLLASGITFITALSASAIATNMRVGVGGEYYMVSRSLGMELGGAIGIPLFLCRTLSLTLYSFGLAESVAFLWPAAWGEPPVQWMAAAFIVLITAIAGRSAELSLKLQIPIMVAVGASLVALTAGVLSGELVSPEWGSHYERSAPAGFWYVFAVFFPAVTGFTAGVGMSGDLEDPKRAIPRGTLPAVATGTAVYLLINVLLAVTGKVDGETLSRLDPNAPPLWTGIALLGFWFVYPGMWGAILSSAFGSALGGPRVLQALSSDGLAPRALARTSRTGQPTVATWVAGAIALAAVALGDLNAVGRWVTIFFLTLYVTMNLAAAVECLVGDPSYRPTIRVPWWVSAAGALGAVAVMFLISPAACVAAVALEGLLYAYLRSRALESALGDVRAGLWTALARFALLRLRQVKHQARNWRPHILLFTYNPARRMGLVRMASWFNQNRGVVTVCRVVEGDLETDEIDLRSEQAAMDDALDGEGMVAFSKVEVVPDFESGIIGIAQANGFAGLRSNTLMFGWPNDRERLGRLLRVMRTVARLDISTAIARLPDHDGPAEKRRMDVWWRGKQLNGDLMLLLAHLLSLNPEWRRARIVVRTIVADEDERQTMARPLTDLLTEARIDAETDVIVRPAHEAVRAVIKRVSGEADIVFLGLNVPLPGEETAYAGELFELCEGLPTVVFVRSAGRYAGDLI